jgi:hypothetical protein
LQDLGVRAALCEVRGDWKFFKDTFRFPGWNTKAGICWRCTCTPAELRTVGLDAPWRQDRVDHWKLLQRLLENHVTLSPLFAAPWVRSCVFKMDWLHCADQGVSADFLGNLFQLFLERRKLPGASAKERCSSLWARIQDFYRAHQVEDKLQGLRTTMICQEGKAPKLRCSAAQCRALVPLGKQLADALLCDEDPEEAAAKEAAGHLASCYQALSASSIFWEEALAAASRKFALLLVALEAHRGHPWRWRVKPKLHLWLELCSEGSQPSSFWTYRDEDFGGFLARLSRRRGGLLRPGATSRNLLQKFCIKEPVPRLL